MMLLGVGAPSAGITYNGPGDIKSSATAYWGLNAYNAAYANGTNPLADLVASTGGAAVCTLRVATNGQADLAASYCAATTPALACAAATGGSCKIAKLYDQVGTNHLVQATSASQPALTFSAVGSLPGLTFGGSQSLVSTSALTLALPFSISYAAKRTVFANSYNSVFSGGPAGTVQVGFSTNTGKAFMYSGTGTIPEATAAESTFHSVQNAFAVVVANSTISVDSGSGTTVNPGTSSFSSSTLDIGLTSPLTGVVLAVGLWPVQFSGGDNSNLNSNAHTNWGF